MENNTNKENIFLFPGFSQDKILYGDYSYINIWEEKYHNYDLSKAKYLIGHSMGSLPALMNWKKNKDATVILFNPLLPKRNYFNLLFRYIFMLITSPRTIRAIKGRTSLKYFYIAWWNATVFLKTNAIEVIKEIPESKIIIIKGEKDKYFCDKGSVKVLEKFQVPYNILSGVGHYWVPEVDIYIKQFIK